ncbi:hypothetical protein N8T08_002550 [Aspergillus melleus]|uniref:Uncharacterized protein n=1 Tax=Aspergillus melleus TaxID=138277 RepID=A0ACC3B8U2_9EURO|nr:hypothetical protein N8T08_002550 [Aspergillus melleus]
MYPNVAHHSVDEDACSAYASTIQPSFKSLGHQVQPNETGQVLFYTRCFLDLVYPLYPIMCEDAIYDAVTTCIKDGFQNNMTSALVMLMVCLGKLYSSPSSADEAIGYLNMATQLLDWLPMATSLDYAQAHGLSALCFAKLSMLSTASGYLQRASGILHRFLLEQAILSPPRSIH